MPLHPVPILIGTTLAVIGSGYAFKKFVYDPHLAPYIDAFIAAHLVPSPPPFHRQQVPVHAFPTSSANSTARRDRGTELRRRRRVSRDDHIDCEPLLRTAAHEDTYDHDVKYKIRRRRVPPSHAVSPHQRSPSPVLRSRPHPADFTRDQTDLLQASVDDNGVISKQAASIPMRPLDPIDAPWMQEHRQLRSKMLNPSADPLAITTETHLQPRDRTHESLPSTAPRPVHLEPLSPTPIRLTPQSASVLLGSPQLYPESTSFSFLSLSQSSSPVSLPVSPGAMVQSLTLDQLVEEADVRQFSSPPISIASPVVVNAHNLESIHDQWTDVPRISARAREEDVFSLPETSSTSGYEDAEIYSPGVVPRRLHLDSPILPLPSPPMGEMTMSPMIQSGEGWDGLRRGPMSVVSLSESEGWGGGSDWGEVRSGASM